MSEDEIQRHTDDEDNATRARSDNMSTTRVKDGPPAARAIEVENQM